MGATCGAPLDLSRGDTGGSGHFTCHARPRQFPRATRGIAIDEDDRRGECLLFLEYARGVPRAAILHGFTCQATSSKSHGSPSVRAWVESEDGMLIGSKAEWPAKHSKAPSWHSARSLGFPLTKHHASDATLCIELRDRSTLLGSLRKPLQDVSLHQSAEYELQLEDNGATEECAVAFQILDSDAVLDQRTVFLVRHGESVWNKAQSELDIPSMARTVDHPLSQAGLEQAEALRARLAKAARNEDANASAMLRPDAVLVSPLTRALQTAAVALGPLLVQRAEEQQRSAEFVLMANAREKQTLGGFDTWATEVGADIPRRAFQEMQDLFQGKDDNGVLRSFANIHIDTQEVEDRWWGDGAETPAQLDERLQEFMAQLSYSPHRIIVVVGHSFFFREIFRRFMCQEFVSQNPDFCRAARSKKMMNCGVMRLDWDPRRDRMKGPIVSAELVIGSQFEDEIVGGSLLACCAAPSSGRLEDEENAFAEFEENDFSTVDSSGSSGASSGSSEGGARTESSSASSKK